MKKLIFILIAIFFAISSYSQTEERFEVKGTVKLIATWSGKMPNDASGTLTTGDKIFITFRQIGVYVNVIHNNVTERLVATVEFEEDLERIIKVYEYDFDSDGQKEIIVINSPYSSIATVEVFKYSGGLAKRVGNFNGQFDIVLDKNTIYLPYGSQGLGDEYLYKDGAFFELLYHDPDKKDK